MSVRSKKMLHILQATGILSLLIFIPASVTYANCALLNSENVTHDITIQQSYLPVYDGSGYKHPGCIVQTDGKIIGYTPYNYLCNLSADEKIKVRLVPSCCDTGPNSGDLACTVRTTNILGFESAHGNGQSVVPVDKDARAIDDLVETLKGEYIFSYYSAAKKYKEYLDDKKYREAALSRKNELKEIFINGKKIQQTSMVGYLLLQMDGVDNAEKADFVIKILESETVFFDIIAPTLEIASQIQDQSNKIAPALIYYLKRKYYDEQQSPKIFEALEKYNNKLKPFLKELLEFEFEWSNRGSNYDFKEREAYWNRMKSLVCDISTNEEITKARKNTNHSDKKNISYFVCNK